MPIRSCKGYPGRPAQDTTSQETTDVRTPTNWARSLNKLPWDLF